jgi:hypothetical protein
MKTYSVQFIGNVTIEAESEAEAKRLFARADITNQTGKDILESIEIDYVQEA